MKKTLFQAITLLLFLNSGLLCKAQDDSIPIKSSHGEAKISYASNSVYLGRKDSLPIHYITPQFGFYDRSGLFINGSFSYLSSTTESQVDVFTIEAGYQYQLNDHWDGSFSFEKYFYNSTSHSVKSEVSGVFTAGINYSSDVLNTFGSLNLNFGAKTDYGFNAGLSHSFNIGEQFTLEPQASLNAATQNFYKAYYEKRRYSAKRKTPNTNITVSITSDVGQLKILDYEFALPVHYKVRNFEFFLEPTLALPVNPNTVNLKINNFQKTFQEKFSSTAFFELGFSYKIGRS